MSKKCDKYGTNPLTVNKYYFRWYIVFFLNIIISLFLLNNNVERVINFNLIVGVDKNQNKQ